MYTCIFVYMILRVFSLKELINKAYQIVFNKTVIAVRSHNFITTTNNTFINKFSFINMNINNNIGWHDPLMIFNMSDMFPHNPFNELPVNNYPG